MSKIVICEKCKKQFRFKYLPEVSITIDGKNIILCNDCQREIKNLIKNKKEPVFK